MIRGVPARDTGVGFQDVELDCKAILGPSIRQTMAAEYESAKPDVQSSRWDCFEHARQRALEMLENNASQTAILTCLVTGAEMGAGAGAVSSILLLDEDGLLRNGASPNLPRDYLNAIDRLKPDPAVGTCAAAAATGKTVVAPDFRADGK